MTPECRTEAKVRIGVIGLGSSAQSHLKAYNQLPNAKIVALAGLEEDRLRQLGTMYNITHLYSQYDALLARNDLDAISICTPNHLHPSMAITALQSGKHVLCEKPLARTAAEARQMIQAAIRAKRVLSVVFNQRARNDVQILKKYVTSGSLGNIYYVKASWMRRNGIPMMGSWFVNKEMAGGGSLLDIGTHILDLSLHLLDEPKVLTVSATTHAKLGTREDAIRRVQTGWKAQKYHVNSKFEVEDLAVAFIRLSGETTLCLEASWATQNNVEDDWNLVFYGTHGGAELKVKNYLQADTSQKTLTLFTDILGDAVEIVPNVVVVNEDGHLFAIQDFITAITSNNWTTQICCEALTRARIIDACYASATQGREIQISLEQEEEFCA